MRKYNSIMLFGIIFLLMPSFDYALTLNKVKGNVAECVYEKLNPTIGKVYGEYNSLNGIDHIFVKRKGTEIVDCLIVDSKFGSANLAKNRLDEMTREGNLHQMSVRHLDQILNRLEHGNYEIPPGLMDKKDAMKIVKSQKRGDYSILRKMVQNKQCKKRVFHLSVDRYGNVDTEYKIVEDIDDKRVRTRSAKAGEKTLYHKRRNNPKVVQNFRQCFAKQICTGKKSKLCIENIIKKLERNPTQYTKLLEKRFPSEKLQKISRNLTSPSFYKTDNIRSMKDYQKVAKRINRKAIAVPAVLTQDDKLIMSLKSAAYSGIAVVGIESGMAYYDFLKGDIYRSEFNQKVIESAIKGTAVGGSEALVMLLLPTPQGLVLLGAGIGAYIIVDEAIKKYKHYKEKHFLNVDDLRVYGIELDSVLDIEDDGIPMNVDRW